MLVVASVVDGSLALLSWSTAVIETVYVVPNRRAAEAGFDGIHIHGGNGYLISEFCSPHANTREDEWGGDAERRSRFFFEVAEAVRSAVGDDLPVTARLSVEDSVEGGLQRDESLALSLLDGVVEAVAWNGRSRLRRWRERTLRAMNRLGLTTDGMLLTTRAVRKRL